MSVMTSILGTSFVIVGALVGAFGNSANRETITTVGFIIAIFGVVIDFISVGMAFGFI